MTPRRATASMNSARSRSTRNRTKFVRTRVGSNGPSPGCARWPGETTPGIAAIASARRRAFRWSSSRRSIMPASPSCSATRPAAAMTPTWRIPPPTILRARRARKMKSFEPTTTEPIGQARPLLRQNVSESAGPARSRGVSPNATAALKKRAPSTCSGTPCSWARSATRRVYARSSGWPIESAWVFSSATMPVSGLWKSPILERAPDVGRGGACRRALPGSG